PDFSQLDWLITLVHPGATDAGNGIALDKDFSHLYVTGAWDNSHDPFGGHTQDVLLGRLSDLSNPNGPHLDSLASFPLSLGPSSGTNIVVDAGGRADIAGTLGYTGNDVGPALFQVPAGGSGLSGWYYQYPGPDNSMNGVALDGAGNVYGVGRGTTTGGTGGKSVLPLVKF